MKEKVSGVLSMLILRVDLFSWFPKTEKWEQAQDVLLTQCILYPVCRSAIIPFSVFMLFPLPQLIDIYMYLLLSLYELLQAQIA